MLLISQACFCNLFNVAVQNRTVKVLLNPVMWIWMISSSALKQMPHKSSCLVCMLFVLHLKLFLSSQIIIILLFLAKIAQAQQTSGLHLSDFFPEIFLPSVIHGCVVL